MEYRKATSVYNTKLFGRNTSWRGHEFHYSQILSQPDDVLFSVVDASNNPVQETGSVRGNVTGTFFHLIAESKFMTGFVGFVGSGPGDPQLLTLKAVDRLKKADAVLFDDLSSGPILQFARKGADLVGVGKRANRPSPKQDAVSQLLVEYARNGGHIVRLKSGNPGIFGRLEEEIIELKKAGISYEIIPGISSAFAAAAEAGIPLTRRLGARRINLLQEEI